MEKMLEEVEYWKAVIKKHFNKTLVMTEADEQHFKTMDGCHIESPFHIVSRMLLPIFCPKEY